MPVINNGNVMSLSDWSKSLGPDGQVSSDVIMILSQTNKIIADAGWIEGNLPIGNQGEIQTGLPPSFYVGMNQFVPVGNDTVAPILEQAATLEAFTQVAQNLAELGGMGNVAKTKKRKGKAQLESFNQTFAKTLIYGSAVNPASFIGFNSRYSSLSAVNGVNILDGGGTGGTNASIYLVVWGEETCTMFFPQGSKAGIVHEDLGLVTAQSISAAGTTDANPMLQQVYREHWIWKHGLYLPDWRYVVRIANIDMPSLLAKNGADLIDLLERAVNHVPALEAGRPAIYMNRTMYQMFGIQCRDSVQKGGQLSYEVVDGIRVPVFQGVPIRIVDQMINTESRVV